MSWFGRSVVIAALALLMMTQPARVDAALLSLTSDLSTGTAAPFEVDPSSGDLTSLGGGIAACCEFGYGATALDPVSSRIYAVGPDSGTGQLRLLSFPLDGTPGSVVGQFGTDERVVALEYERGTGRLLAALASVDNHLRLVSIDPATASATEIHAGLADCCETDAAVSATTGGGFFLTGRLRNDPGTTRLIRFSTSGNGLTTQVPLGGTLGALVDDPATGELYGVQQIVQTDPVSASAQLVHVAGNGALTAIGSAHSQCCVVSVDIATISEGNLRVVATELGETDLSVLSIDLASGAFLFSTSPLQDDHVLNGMFALGADPTTLTISTVSPTLAPAGEFYTVFVNVSSVSGPVPGTVFVVDDQGDSCTISLPETHCSIRARSQGPLTITATYSGTDVFASSSDLFNIQIIAPLSIPALSDPTAWILLLLLLAFGFAYLHRGRLHA